MSGRQLARVRTGICVIRTESQDHSPLFSVTTTPDVRNVSGQRRQHAGTAEEVLRMVGAFLRDSLEERGSV